MVDHDQFAETVRGMRESAAAYVRRYAALKAPTVGQEALDAICRALGEVSVDEATAALDRMQAEGV